MAQVKTYRNSHTDVLKVGDLEINPGELVPEAGKWEDQVLRSHLRTNRLEVVWLDQEAFDQEMAERNERLDYYPDEDEENKTLNPDNNGEEEADGKPKKRVVRKRGKLDGDEPSKLDEQTV